MSRLIVVLVVLLAVVAAGLWFLAGSAKERPATRIEQPVELNSLAG